MRSSLGNILFLMLLLSSRAVGQEPTSNTSSSEMYSFKEVVTMTAKKTWSGIKISLYAIEVFSSASFFLYLQVFDEEPYTLEMFYECVGCRLGHAGIKLLGHVTFLGTFFHGSIGLISTLYPIIKEKIKKKLSKEPVNA